MKETRGREVSIETNLKMKTLHLSKYNLIFFINYVDMHSSYEKRGVGGVSNSLSVISVSYVRSILYRIKSGPILKVKINY